MDGKNHMDWNRIAIISSDHEWCSDDTLEDFLDLQTSLEVPTTLFVTHDSALLKDVSAFHTLELGAHPNFLPGSSHGVTREQV